MPLSLILLAVFLLTLVSGRIAYLNLGRFGGLRVGAGRLERTRMRDTRGLPFINFGRDKFHRRRRK